MSIVPQTPPLDPESALAGVEHAENAIELKEIEGLSQGRIVFRRFIRHKGAMIALAVLVVVAIVAFTSEGFSPFGIHIPGWWRYNYADTPPTVNNLHPTLHLWPFHLGQHPFGQDEIGHDMFAEVMRGAQQSIKIVVVVGLVSTFIGSVIGAVAGYYGGLVDALLMRLTDMVIIVPQLVLAAIIGHYAGGGAMTLALLLGLLFWTSLARLVRGEVLALRSREFVEAAKIAGASDFRIMFKHILPNAAGVIIVSMTLTMAAAILLETSLSYLGLGVKPPDVSLGYLMNLYASAAGTRPWLFWWTGILIVIIALAVNFIGDGLRDAYDPRQRRMMNRKAKLAKASGRPQPTTSEATEEAVE